METDQKELKYIEEKLVFDPKGSHEKIGSDVFVESEYEIKPKGHSTGYKISFPFMKWCDVCFTHDQKIIINPGGIFGSKIRNIVRVQNSNGDIMWRTKKEEFEEMSLLEADGSKYDLHMCEYIFWFEVKKEGLRGIRKLITPNYYSFLS